MPVPVTFGKRVERAVRARAQRKPGIAFRPFTMTSRRRRNSATIASTASCGPSSAAMPARWVKLAVQELELTISWSTASASHSGITP